MLDFLNLKTEAFGIDVSDLSLKIISAEKKKSGFVLASFGEAEIKPGLIKMGEVKEEETLAKIIQKAIQQVKGKKIKTNYIVASLPEEKAFLQVIQMPKLSPEDLKSAVIFEAENYIPLPIEEVYLDFQVVPPIKNDLDHLDVLIAALPKKIVDSYFSFFKKAGLRPLILEIESMAIARALIKDGFSPQPVILVDLGEMRTSFVAFSGKVVRFTSSIPISGQKMTEAISQTLKVDLKQAEKLKLKYGLETKGEKEGGEVFEALIPSLTDLVEQIHNCLCYYQTHSSHEHLLTKDKEVKKVILCGGGANLKGITKFLSRELKLPVEIGNPWVNIFVPEKIKDIPELNFAKSLSHTTAIGLAIKGISLG